MTNFIDRILEKKREEIERLKVNKPLKIFYDKIKLENKLVAADKRDFKQAIVREKVNIIAEIKKTSPSKGNLNLGLDVANYAKMYEKAGAAAISVLTEENFFKGKLDDLITARNAVKIPVLRKDFVIDAYQIFEAKFAGADAVLLIADVLDEKTLSEFLIVVKYLEIDALVEVHDEENMKKAIRCKAEIIGINNRCLKDFSVDIATTKRLRNMAPEDKIIVSESGIFEKEDIQFLLDSSVKTFLIGEAIVKSSDPFEKIKSLKETGN